MNKSIAKIAATFTLLIGAGVHAQLVPPPPDGGINPDEIVISYPAPEYGDLQAAIDAVPEDGRLRIGPGKFEVPEPVTISKRITIQGAGCRATSALESDAGSPRQLVRAIREANASDLPFTRLVGPRPSDVVAPDESSGLFSFLGGAAGGAVLDVEIVGHHAGIYVNDVPMPGDIGGEPGAGGNQQPALKIADACISGTSRGVHLRTSAQVDISNTIIWKPLHNGISVSTGSGEPDRALPLTLKSTMIYTPFNGCIYQNGGVLVMLDTPLIGCGSDGAVFANNNATVIIGRSNFVQLSGPGITLVDSQAFVHNSQIRNATGTGIFLTRSDLQLKDSRILDTIARPSDGLYGDGIDAIEGSNANLARNLIANTARTGIANFGSTLRLADNKVQCASFELQAETYPLINPVYNPLWIDDSGNTCGCPVAINKCLSISSSVAPPEQQGGLE